MNALLQETKISGFRSQLVPTSLSFSSAILSEAEDMLNNNDFPTTRHEDWKYTRVTKIAALQPSQNEPVKHPQAAQFAVNKAAIQVIFQNGKLHTNFSGSLPAGLTIQLLSECTAEDLATIGSPVYVSKNVFNALNTLYASDGVYIKVAAKTVLDNVIEIIHLQHGENQVANLRHVLVAGAFSKAEINQVYASSEAKNCFTNVVTEGFVETNAHLTINKLQNEEEGNFSVATEQIAQEKDSFFQINTLTLNGSLVRNNVNAEVNGANCTTNMYGAYILKDTQHVDNHTVIDHKAPHCNSNELYRGVMDDKSTGVFNGKVFVRKDSQKINAFQSNGNVLLSDTATINSKPELEIYADDVKCSHGSTTGQLDEEAVFYLRARGLSERSARNLMVSAFVADVLNHIEQQAILDSTYSILKTRFGWDLQS
jgi:Fe-S cluster assembly protein SufD